MKETPENIFSTPSSPVHGKKELKTPNNHPVYFRIVLSLRKFSADLGGVILISLAILSFLGLLRFTQGYLIDLWTNNLERGFGWGSYLISFFFLYLGFLILFRRKEIFPKLNLGRILTLEGLIFIFLMILAIFGGFSIDRAEIGLDGGIVGWGLSTAINRLIPVPISTIFLFAGLLILLLNIFGGWAKLKVKIKLFPDQNNQETDLSAGQDVDNDNIGNPITDLLHGSTESLNQKNESGFPSTNVLVHTLPINLQFPPSDILLEKKDDPINKEYIHSQALQIEKTLSDFHVPIKVAGFRVGPTIIQYAIELGDYEKVNEIGEIVRKRVKMSDVSRLEKDLTLALEVERLRMETPIPGHAYVGIEIPNHFSTKVRLRTILESQEYKNIESVLGLALGLNVANHPVVADLARMPHLLIGGTTGSGKSVCIIGLITCLLMKNSPATLRLILLDPKKVELIHFDGIPHLIGPVETEPKRMVAALQWAVGEMDRRFKLLEDVNARDLDSYNQKMFKRNLEGLSRIVIVIDELADLMLLAAEQTEISIARLAQMARATGIHLIVSTQRPSTNIVTGLIKSNFPARLAFMTASQMDSRVILDTSGAENLLGKGDMLFLNPEASGLQRAQAPKVEDGEIEKLVAFWKGQYPSVNTEAPWEGMALKVPDNEYSDNLFEKAIQVIQQEGKASASLLQRRLNIGYPRAARLIDELEKTGYVGPAEVGGKERSVNFPHNDDQEEPGNY